MTRTALFSLFILAALVIAAPRPPAQEIPSAKGDSETDPMLGTGAPPTPQIAPPSPSASSVHDAFGVTSEGTLRAVTGTPSPVRSATASQDPTAGRRVAARATAKAPARVVRPSGGSSAAGRLLTGTMSWYCLPGRSACTTGVSTDCACAAAGPRLRAALGDWRGREVTVSAGNVFARVRLVDWCRCDSGYLLDGYAALWGGLGLPLSAGVVAVTVTW